MPSNTISSGAQLLRAHFSKNFHERAISTTIPRTRAIIIKDIQEEVSFYFISFVRLEQKVATVTGHANQPTGRNGRASTTWQPTPKRTNQGHSVSAMLACLHYYHVPVNA